MEKKKKRGSPRPRCVLMLMYRAVPLKLFRSRYGMCCFVFGSRYCFAMPKSTTWITAAGGGEQASGEPSRSTADRTDAGRPRTVGVLRAGAADEEVVRLDVAVDEVLVVHGLHPGELDGGVAVVWSCGGDVYQPSGEPGREGERGVWGGAIRTHARSRLQRTEAGTHAPSAAPPCRPS